MPDYRATLRKVGLVLVLIGLLDIALMVYVIAHGHSYSSSLNIFAVVAGIFLIRGSLKAVRLITSFLAFLLAAMFTMLLFVVPFFIPLDLWLTEWRLGQRGTVLGLGLALLALGVLVWVYRKLRSPGVLEARAKSGQAIAAPRLALALGTGLAVVMALLFHTLMHGDDATKAIELAQAKTGAGYKYSVIGLRRANSTVHAEVAAYNDHEIIKSEFSWTH